MSLANLGSIKERTYPMLTTTILSPAFLNSASERKQYLAAMVVIDRIDGEMKAMSQLDGSPVDSVEAPGLVSVRAGSNDGHASRGLLQFEPESSRAEKFLQVRDDGPSGRMILEYESPNATFAGSQDRYKVSQPWSKDPGSNQVFDLHRETGTITILDGSVGLASMFTADARRNGFID
jgi:hypothetical protein